MSELADIVKTNFPEARFRAQDRKRAGMILKVKGQDAAVEYLRDKQQPKGSIDFNPPVKCSIVAQSRPFEEWPVYKTSVAIQKYIYSLTKQQLDTLEPGTSKASHDAWFTTTGVEADFRNVQGLNYIFKNARRIYEGVIKKVENRNEKARKRHESRLDAPEKPFVEESAFGEDGRLAQPPGPNPSIYGYANAHPHPCKDTRGLEGVPAAYQGYVRDTKAIIANTAPDRLSIPKGQPGYVPEHQRAPGGRGGTIKEGGSHRRRRWYANANHKPKPERTSSKYSQEQLAAARAADALLAIVRINDDWALIDVRALLRDVRRRGIEPLEGVSVATLLDLFTGDVVIDTRRNVVTFTYKPGVAQVPAVRTIRQNLAPEKLLSLTETGPVALVSIDLGQTHPMAYRISRVTSSNEALSAEPVTSDFLPSDIILAVSRYRASHDALEHEIRERAKQSLTQEQQDEIRRHEQDGPETVRSRICETLHLDRDAIPWDKMGRASTYIADILIARGDDAVAHMETREGTMKMRDYRFASRARLRLSDDTRKALNEAVWKLKTGNVEYDKLARRKTEIARRSINFIIREAKHRTLCGNVVLNVEDLNVGFFHGKGKQTPGWDGFFVPRSENRWLIQANHKACCERSLHQGVLVIESLPHRTSITCPVCSHCEPGNRSGVDFKCLRCGVLLHADRDVATANLERVALTGRGLPKPVERPGDAQRTGLARTRKSSSRKRKTVVTPNTLDPQAVEDGGARKPVYNTAEQLDL